MPFIRINVHNCNRFINSDHIIWVEGRPQGGSFVNTVDAMLLSEDSPETIMERILAAQRELAERIREEQRETSLAIAAPETVQKAEQVLA